MLTHFLISLVVTFLLQVDIHPSHTEKLNLRRENQTKVPPADEQFVLYGLHFVYT